MVLSVNELIVELFAFFLHKQAFRATWSQLRIHETISCVVSRCQRLPSGARTPIPTLSWAPLDFEGCRFQRGAVRSCPEVNCKRWVGGWFLVSLWIWATLNFNQFHPLYLAPLSRGESLSLTRTGGRSISTETHQVAVIKLFQGIVALDMVNTNQPECWMHRIKIVFFFLLRCNI